jgi:hypothetical protein
MLSYPPEGMQKENARRNTRRLIYTRILILNNQKQQR